MRLEYRAERDIRVTSIGDKQTWCVVAAEGDRRIGACSVVNAPTFSRISTLYVLPEARRRGIATKLINFALENVVDAGNDVYVECDAFDMREWVVEGEPPMTDDHLFLFYCKLGFDSIPGHPFSLVLRRKTAET